MKSPSVLGRLPRLSWWLFVFGLLFTARAMPSERLSAVTDVFAISARPIADGRQILMARNRGRLPLVVVIRAEGELIESSPAWPIVVTLPPKSYRRVAVLGAVKRQLSRAFRIVADARVGQLRASNTQPVPVFGLPFPPHQSVLISQASDGPLLTHLQPVSREAVDFVLPEGTPVRAAKGGWVSEIIAGFFGEGGDESALTQANSVTLFHDDGTYSAYVHLAPGRVPISVGHWIEAGALLGYSGNTGYSNAPHLHFAVLELVVASDGTMDYRSIPFLLKNGKNAVPFRPRSGMRVGAVDHP